jgi:hypothetical protein
MNRLANEFEGAVGTIIKTVSTASHHEYFLSIAPAKLRTAG